jgi:DNA replication protein DnaC
MEQIGEILKDFRERGFNEVEGTCEKHGASKALMMGGEPWRCGKCLEAAMAADTREQWLAERNKTLVQIAHLPAKFMGKTWPAGTDEQKAARAMVRTFWNFFVSGKAWGALIFIGKTGTGKTWLATEFAESLIRKLSKSVRYVTAQGIVSEIQASYGKDGKSEESEIDRFVQYDLLIIDEIDVKRNTDNANLLLTEVINRRYSNEKPVLVITNQALDNLEQFVGDRVFSRLHENAFVCSFGWPDFRRG